MAQLIFLAVHIRPSLVVLTELGAKSSVSNKGASSMRYVPVQAISQPAQDPIEGDRRQSLSICRIEWAHNVSEAIPRETISSFDSPGCSR